MCIINNIDNSTNNSGNSSSTTLSSTALVDGAAPAGAPHGDGGGSADAQRALGDSDVQAGGDAGLPEAGAGHAGAAARGERRAVPHHLQRRQSDGLVQDHGRL